MKNWKKYLIFCFMVVIVLEFICCKEDDPEPAAQSKTLSNVLTAGGTVNVIINYTAIPGITPSYMSLLEKVINDTLTLTTDKDIDLIINVVGGDSEFIKTISKTLSVGESWLSKATEFEMAVSLELILDRWTDSI